MSDLYVHVRMKECCRKALAEIDTIKKGIGGTGAFKVSLVKILGEKAIPQAQSALATTIGKSTPEGDRRLTSIKKKSCAKAAAAHAAVHKGKGETLEAAFWDSLSAVFDGKSAAGLPAHTAPASEGGTAPLPENGATAATSTSQDPPYVGLSRFAQEHGFTVTSTTGGQHNSGSAHYEGRAIDVGTNDHTDAQIQAFMNDARAAGIHVRDERTHPPGQKVWKGPHIHLDVPAGTSFP